MCDLDYLPSWWYFLSAELIFAAFSILSLGLLLRFNDPNLVPHGLSAFKGYALGFHYI